MRVCAEKVYVLVWTKSIAMNTCSQIFTDGEVSQMAPMRSNSEAGTKLDRINQGAGGK